MNRTTESIQVLLVDDSALFAEGIMAILHQDPRLRVVGLAANGEQAVAMTESLRPDVVIMDVLMPVMDGLAAIEAIMGSRPTPILVMTSDPRGRSGELSVEALRRGALELITKPLTWPGTPEEQAALSERVRFLAGIPVVRHVRGRRSRVAEPRVSGTRATNPDVIAIASSTGGPAALAAIVADLPKDLPVPILVVQHLDSAFQDALVKWLNDASALEVCFGEHGAPLVPGRIFVAPADRHMEVDGVGRIVLTDAEPYDGHRPSGTVLLRSVAAAYGERAIGVVLTGMGRDGADGLKRIHDSNGATIAQDEASSVVFGMPRAAIELGAASVVLGVDGIAKTLLEWVSPSGGQR